MVPPRIELGFCPRQGHVLAIGLWDLKTPAGFFCKLPQITEQRFPNASDEIAYLYFYIFFYLINFI
jgi:hypothetical protein